MPTKSEKQRRFMGAELARKRAGKKMQTGMSEKQLAETYDTYISDAEGAGDQELAQFFREVQEEERRRSVRAKELLGRKLAPR